MKTRICYKCKTEKKISEFIKDRRYKEGIKTECKDCKKKYNKNYRLENPQIFARNVKNYRQKLRLKFLEMYGEKCSCPNCNETKHEFLTLDHVLGRNEEEKLQRSVECYLDATKKYNPDKYRILCWNCNCSRGRYGYCPHENPYPTPYIFPGEDENL